jgi:hypothetical protein
MHGYYCDRGHARHRTNHGLCPVESLDLCDGVLLDNEPEFEPDDEPESDVELLLGIAAPYVALIKSAARSAIPYAVAIVCTVGPMDTKSQQAK